MELKAALKKLKGSEEFKEWDAKNPENFLSYAFKMIESDKDSPWQFGFYYRATDKVTSFIATEDKIEVLDEEEVFKKPDTKVEPVDIEKVSLPFEKIMKKAEEFQKHHYSAELVDRTISILHNIEEYGTIWNITYITRAFKTLNMKINPENGKVEHHNASSLMDLVKK